MKRFVFISFCLFLFTCILNAQASNVDSLLVIPDSTTLSRIEEETPAKKLQEEISDTVVKPEFKPDPAKVVWMGALIPGYGQILNRSYWKLPIVYAGFLGFAYAINWNATRYETYRLAYIDIVDDNDNTNSHLELFPEGYNIENYPGGIGGLESNLSTAYKQFRRNRDLSVIATVAYYAITIVEAYVDAQLFDFDISPDLSLQVRPTLLENKYGVSNSPGFQLSLNLK